MAIIPKISVISYLDAVPFVYGLQHADSLRADVVLVTPADSARNFIEGKADIALVPAAAVPQLKDANIVTDYCIGAVGAVRSVAVVANEPISKVKRIWVDDEAHTAVQLCGHLAERKWHIAPEWLLLNDYTTIDTPKEGDAFLLVGDKILGYEGRFKHTLDLASEWRTLTAMPFAFAVWVARKGVSFDVVDALQHALTFGVEHIWESITELGHMGDDGGITAYEYLTRNIDYILDDEKHKALKKFWDAGLRVTPRSY